MKKLFAVLITFVLVFAACDDGDDNSTTLRIRNESYIEINDVIWNNISFTDNKSEGSIITGTNVSKNVEQGAGYIYFKRKGNPVAVRTRDVVTVAKNEQKEFVLTDNIIIVDVNNTANTDTIGMFYKKPQITVKRYGEIINNYGEINLGSPYGELDNPYIIENTGEMPLTFVPLNGSYLYLQGGDNPNNIFSITQRPPVTMELSPGNTASFVIHFSPYINGVFFPFSAWTSVYIKTNSHVDSDFSFRISSNGRN